MDFFNMWNLALQPFENLKDRLTFLIEEPNYKKVQ